MANTAESFVICISLLYNQGVGGLDTPGRAHLHGGKSKRVGTTPCHGQLQFVRNVKPRRSDQRDSHKRQGLISWSISLGCHVQQVGRNTNKKFKVPKRGSNTFKIER